VERTIDDASAGIAKISTATFDNATTLFNSAFGSSSPFKIAMDKLKDVLNIKQADDFVSFPGNNRMLTGPEGTFEINENDTIIAGTDFPKTEEEVKKMMENLRSPQNPLISSPIETKPILTTENMGMSAIEKQREKSLTDIMMSMGMDQKQLETTAKEIKSTNDINHKLDMTIDLKNVPTNMNQSDLKTALETMILKPEFLDKVRTATKAIEGTSFY
jgi:hypothetical protein